MDTPGPVSFVGEVRWLRADEGGRASGPPSFDPYAQVACVPPADIDSGAASFVLTDFVTGAWVSPARGRWLVVASDGPQCVSVGDVVAIHEGRRHVADFRVEAIDP